MGKVIWAVACCALALGVKPAEGLSSDGSISLFDPTIDRATESYVHVEISDETSACFRLPRNVIVKELREFFSQSGLAFDSRDLLDYLSGKTSVRVGNEERKVDEALIDCLAAPVPEAIMISDGPPSRSHTLETLKSRHLELNLPPLGLVVTDLSGYRRYVSVGPKCREEFYFPDAGPDTHLAFWCGNHFEPEMCIVQGEYDGMSAKIGYRKEAMRDVRSERALNCVRAIGDLFRIDNDKS